jgi:hypothetical protein
MNSKRILAALGLLSLVLVAGWILLFDHSEGPGTESAGKPASASPAAKSEAPDRTAVPEGDVPASPLPEPEKRPLPPEQLIRNAAAQLAADITPEASHTLLQDLFDGLTRAPRAEAVEAVLGYLNEGGDAETQLRFEVGPHGVLRQSPTLRVFLLNLLGRLDPAEAGEYSDVVFQERRSPEEWALGIRNLAWGATLRHAAISDGTRFLLLHRFEEMTAEPDWRDKPSPGYLEAFDTLVYTDAVEGVEQIAANMQADRPRPSQYAAFMVLDRLVIRQPVAVLSQLLDDPGILADREASRAGFFARANPRDPGQERILAAYVLDPERSEEEIEQFAGLFPNHNHMLSHNLLSSLTTRSAADLSEEIDAAREMVESWLGNPQFSFRREALEQILSNLEERAPRAP